MNGLFVWYDTLNDELWLADGKRAFGSYARYIIFIGEYE